MFNFTILVVSVVIEPLEMLTRFFMKLSNMAPDFSRMPPVMDLNYPCASRLTALLQYYSAILAGLKPRTKRAPSSIICMCLRFVE